MESKLKVCCDKCYEELTSSALYKEILNGFPPNILAQDLKAEGKQLK